MATQAGKKTHAEIPRCVITIKTYLDKPYEVSFSGDIVGRELSIARHALWRGYKNHKMESFKKREVKNDTGRTTEVSGNAEETVRRTVTNEGLIGGAAKPAEVAIEQPQQQK